MAKNNKKMRSTISDEELAKLIEQDKKNNPSDFSCGPIVFVDSLSERDLRNISNPSSAFQAIAKWL